MFADFQNSFTVIFSMKFATKFMSHFPSYLKGVTALSRKIRKTKIGENLLHLTQ